MATHPRKSYGQRNLAGYSPWGRQESDTTEAMEHICTQCKWVAYIFLGPSEVTKAREFHSNPSVRGTWEKYPHFSSGESTMIKLLGDPCPESHPPPTPYSTPTVSCPSPSQVWVSVSASLLVGGLHIGASHQPHRALSQTHSGWLFQKKTYLLGNSLVVQWLGPLFSTTVGMSLIPGQRNKIPHAIWCSQNKGLKKKRNLCTPQLFPPVHWPPVTKNWHIGKDPDAGKNWRPKEKRVTEDEMVS